MVHEDDVAQFVDAYSQAVAAFYPDGSTGTDYTSIINEKHYARLTGLLDDARAKGARVVSVGRDRENAPTRAHTLSPSVVLDTTDDMTIMREEIFGPKIGRAHVCTPVTNAQLVCRLLLEQQK